MPWRNVRQKQAVWQRLLREPGVARSALAREAGVSPKAIRQLIAEMESATGTRLPLPPRGRRSHAVTGVSPDFILVVARVEDLRRRSFPARDINWLRHALRLRVKPPRWRPDKTPEEVWLAKIHSRAALGLLLRVTGTWARHDSDMLDYQLPAGYDPDALGVAIKQAQRRWPDADADLAIKQLPSRAISVRADGLPPGSKRIRKWTPAPWGEVGANLSIVLAHAPHNAPTLLAALQAQEVLGRRIRDLVRHQLLLLGQEPGWTDTVARLNKELLARGVTYKYIPGA
jgi:hypothetical protein